VNDDVLDVGDAKGDRRPCVVQYLYVHAPGERFSYPTSRSDGGAAHTAMRYLECALVQAASLRLRDADCELVLVTNLAELGDADAVEQRGVRLLDAMESLGVRIVFADYAHRNVVPVESYASSRYVLDAILAVTDGSDPGRRYWFTDVDCVWVNPEKVFAATPPRGSIGCVLIPYPPEWDIEGTTPQRLGEFGQQLGDCPVPIPWVGGELLCGTAGDLRGMVAASDALDREVGAEGAEIPAEEHVLSLAGGLGRVSFEDLPDVAARILTGPRHFAPPHPDPGSLGLWHLPNEKGLSLRRAASSVLSGHSRSLSRDLADPHRAMKRFNISGAGLTRRVRDDSWLALRRLRQALTSGPAA
jgi:hypothetical protein